LRPAQLAAVRSPWGSPCHYCLQSCMPKPYHEEPRQIGEATSG
jgi:hypothetical protein